MMKIFKPLILSFLFISFTLTSVISSAEPAKKAAKVNAEEMHAKIFNKKLYPSAKECASCHLKIYNEWRASNHAYAFVSPIFNKFEKTIDQLTTGTKGGFCYRCHATVLTQGGETREQALWEVSEVSREGITCITCHRISEAYSLVNGQRRIHKGDIAAAVYGPIGGDGIKKVIAQKEEYNIKTNSGDQPGRKIHLKGIKFEQIDKAEFCVSCHQVEIYPGIKLEVVWDQYRASPALKNDVTCQDCHMGKVPGQPLGYSKGAAAKIGDKIINANRRHGNHSFYGPSLSVAHPGLFPFNPEADRFTPKQWLQFDYRAGWGTEAFEDRVYDGKIKIKFPKVWQEAEDRYDAREIIEDNLEHLAKKDKLRRELLENSSKITGPFFKTKATKVGQSLKFYYELTNKNAGHNFPTASLGAQPQIWMNVALVDPQGKNIWESGYLDSHGDLADLMSEDVLKGRLLMDKQLFNLQTKFLTTNIKGTDREHVLPVNFDVDQRPFIRPLDKPVKVLNHPNFIRMEARSLAPLETRKAKYTVPGELITMPGTYKLSVRLRYRPEPIYFMKFIEATPEIIRRLNESIVSSHAYTVAFKVGGSVIASEAKQSPEVGT